MRRMTIERLRVGLILSNAYIVSADDQQDALLIDAGDDAERIWDMIHKKGKRLRAILLTHGHFDHILAARTLRDWAGAKIYVHKADAGMLSDPALNLYSPGMSHMPYAPFDADILIDPAEKDVLDIAGLHVRLLHTPGHTPGGVCYYFEEEGVLFTGDTLFANGHGRTDFPGGDAAVLQASLERLMSLPSDTEIYPGHENESSIGRVRGISIRGMRI